MQIFKDLQRSYKDFHQGSLFFFKADIDRELIFETSQNVIEHYFLAS